MDTLTRALSEETEQAASHRPALLSSGHRVSISWHIAKIGDKRQADRAPWDVITTVYSDNAGEWAIYSARLMKGRGTRSAAMAQDVTPTPLGLRHLAFVVVTVLLLGAGWFIFYSPGWTRPAVDVDPATAVQEQAD